MHMGDSLSKEWSQTLEEPKEGHRIPHGVNNGLKEELGACAWFNSFKQLFVSRMVIWKAADKFQPVTF